MDRDRRRPILAAAAVALLGAAAGCAATSRAAAPTAPAAPATPNATPTADTAPAGGSLFDRAWVWTDERGAAHRFSEWRGRSIVVALIYTACTTTCPMTVERLRRADESLRRAGRPAELVLVTLDPRADTAAELARYRADRALPPAWHLLRGDDDQTQALADFLRVKIIADGDHVYHDGTIALLDAAGRLVGHLAGQLADNDSGG